MSNSIQLREAKTRAELTTRLGADIKNLDLVSVNSLTRTDGNFNLLAVNGNYSRSILHQKLGILVN